VFVCGCLSDGATVSEIIYSPQCGLDWDDGSEELIDDGMAERHMLRSSDRQFVHGVVMNHFGDR